MKRVCAIGGLLAFVLLASGCHKDQDTPANSSSTTGSLPPSVGNSTGTATATGQTANVQGVWSGTITAPPGSVPVTLTLTQSGTVVSGTFATPAIIGNASGSVSGPNFAFSLVPSTSAVAGCSGSISGVGSVAGNSMSVSLTAAASHAAFVVLPASSTFCPNASLSGQGQLTHLTGSSAINLIQ